MPMSVQKSLAEVWVSGDLTEKESLSVAVQRGTFWRKAPLSSLLPPKFGLRSNSREGTEPHLSPENRINDLLNMAPPIRTRPSFLLSQSLPWGSFHKPLILTHQRADRMKTTITENYPNWSHGPQPCLTQWNYEPSLMGPPKTNRSFWRVLTKHGRLKKGMANHFSILALRTPWTVWKGKKVWHWKMNSPGQ